MSWLLIAAEPEEFSGVMSRATRVSPLEAPGIAYAKIVDWNPGKTFLMANGPGPELAAKALCRRLPVDGLMSVGFCGALDPRLEIGDIVVSGEFPGAGRKQFHRGEVLS